MQGHLQKSSPSRVGEVTLSTQPTNLMEQFSMLPLPDDPVILATHMQAVCTDFQQINLDWLLSHRSVSDITNASPQLYQLRTPADKFCELL